jgi:RNA polymerase-binding transcription factor DksA
MSQGNHDRTEPVAAPPSTPTYWTEARLVKAASTLWGRVAALRADIARELRKHDDERFGLIATNVADSAELAIADVIGDVYLAEIDRDVRELRDVEGALKRIDEGTYGLCVDCSQAIDPMRLGFSPHAARCLHCQESAERSQQRATHSATL